MRECCCCVVLVRHFSPLFGTAIPDDVASRDVTAHLSCVYNRDPGLQYTQFPRSLERMGIVFDAGSALRPAFDPNNLAEVLDRPVQHLQNVYISTSWDGMYTVSFRKLTCTELSELACNIVCSACDLRSVRMLGTPHVMCQPPLNLQRATGEIQMDRPLHQWTLADPYVYGRVMTFLAQEGALHLQSFDEPVSLGRFSEAVGAEQTAVIPVLAENARCFTGFFRVNTRCTWGFLARYFQRKVSALVPAGLPARVMQNTDSLIIS